MKQSLIITLGLLISIFTYGQSQNNISKEVVNILLEKTKDFPTQTEISIAFIHNNQVNYLGLKRMEDTIEFTSNSSKIFEIGSISKVFTSTLLANYVLEEKIKLDDPIQEYFNFPLKNKEITVLQLANHSSGLPRLPSNLDLEKVDFSNPYCQYGEKDLKEYLTNKLEPDTVPGTNYAYSNLGAGILGYLLEQYAKSSYEELLQNYITSKYGMVNTTSNIENIEEKLVLGRDSKGEITSNWNLNALVGAGGILSNTEDLAKFTIAQFDSTNKELELTRKSTFDIPKYRMKVGLAWNIIMVDPQQYWYMHNGGTGGYSSILAMDMENKVGIVILSNVSAFHEKARNIDQLCMALMKKQIIKTEKSQ